MTSGQRSTIVGVTRTPATRIPAVAYYPPFIWFGAEPADVSAFDRWASREEHLAILDSLRPHEFLVLTNEVRP